MVAKPLAFVRRDLQIAASYRLSFAESMVMLVVGLWSVELVSRLVNSGSPQELAPYGNDYFGFALIGVAISMFAQAASAHFAGIVRSAQTTGTLEVLLGTRTSLPAFLAFSSFFGLFQSFIRLVTALLIGGFVLGADLEVEKAVLVLPALLAITAAFAGIGIFSAAFVVWFKQREPFTAALTTVSLLLSGILYPVEVLPRWLQAIAPLLPLTHALEAFRSMLLAGASDTDLAVHLAALAAFSLLLPASLVAFQFAVKRAKMAGSLAHY